MRRRPEWIGDTDDQDLPAWVFNRRWDEQGGRCGKCGRPLRRGHVEREHLKPIWSGGENRERNIQLWCRVPCSSVKTAEEARTRAKGTKARAAHRGSNKPRCKRPMPGTKKSGWKHRMDGSWERR